MIYRYSDILHNEELLNFTIDRLNELKDYYDGYGSALHNEIFNTDYYIIGTYQAKEWLGSSVFEAIDTIKEYEEQNFGELTTDISIPEYVVNMYVYIVGEYILGLSEHLQGSCFDRHINSEDIEKIISELE